MLLFTVLESTILQGLLRQRWKELAPIFLDYKYTSKNVTMTTEILSEFYFGSKGPLDAPQSQIAAVRACVLYGIKIC